MARRWSIDPAVAELIRYLDEPSRKWNWEALTRREVEAIRNEIAKCRKSFEYCARNYFWIVDKDRREVNFSLWEAQELILDKLYYLKSKGRAQKLMILKARQLGCSTLIEALIAWRTVFFSNTEALVVSVDKSHAAYLFGILQHIVDRLPWWLQPMVAAREYKDGLWFENPDPEARRDFPGVNSRIVVQAANQLSGIGQGRRLNACHISEGADWPQDIHRATIEGDLQYALADNPDTIAVWESTAKGAGTYTEQLWLANMRLGERAEWYPLFIPWFFEKSRFLPPEKGWKPETEEQRMRERVKDEWVRCDNPECEVIRQNHPVKGAVLEGTTCPSCERGRLVPYVLSDGQLYWMWRQRKNKEAKGEEALKALHSELCTTPQEAFQLSGIQVFPRACQEWVNSTIRSPRWVGDFDSQGVFHAHDSSTGRCVVSWCGQDHRFEDHPLEVWEMPKPGANYVVGVDVAEGLGGRADYSVAWVNEIGPDGTDVQVAMYRSNTIDPLTFAYPVVWLGRWYNTALLSIEYNGIGRSTGDAVRVHLQYPNLYRWKHYDSDRVESNKWHWYTQYNTKPKLWQWAVHMLRSQRWIVRAEQFYEEMLRFQKDSDAYDSVKASAESGWHDDVVMAAMIALYTSHDLDADFMRQSVTDPAREAYRSDDPSNPQAWRMRCAKCEATWSAENPEGQRCPKCGSIMVSGSRPEVVHRVTAEDLLKEAAEYEEEMEEAYEEA